MDSSAAGSSVREPLSAHGPKRNRIDQQSTSSGAFA